MIILGKTINFKVFKLYPTHHISTVNECVFTDYTDSYVWDIHFQENNCDTIDYLHIDRKVKVNTNKLSSR